MTTTKLPGLAYDAKALEAFCERWGVTQVAVFGPAARGELLPESDVDVVVTLRPDSKVSAWDIITMQDELAELFGRSVHLVEEGGISNPYLLKDIERELTPVYAA